MSFSNAAGRIHEQEGRAGCAGGGRHGHSKLHSGAQLHPQPHGAHAVDMALDSLVPSRDPASNTQALICAARSK